MIRRLGLVGAGLVLACWPSVASAQQPLGNCKNLQIHNTYSQKDPVEGKPGVEHNLISGNVEIVCDDTSLYADEVEWWSDNDWVYARGHVLLQEPTIRINADSARLNKKTHLGTFNQVVGSIRVHEQKPPSDQFGAEEPDVLFSGITLEKIGLRTYRLSDGSITTCTQPTPRWNMGSTVAVITPGEHVLMTNMVLRVKDVPVFYIPVIFYPITKEGRSTGFLMPTYGSSSLTGFELNNAFFWAIDRSQDATFTEDWYKKTGQGYGSEYRYALPQGSNGDAVFSLVDQHAATIGTDELPAEDTYSVRANISQALPDNFRLVSQTNYFSSVTGQQLYQQNLADLASSTSTVSAQVSGGIGRYRVSFQADQSDLFTGTAPAQRTGHLALMNFSLPDTPIGHSQVYFGLTDETMYRLDQSNVADPTTNQNLWRTDFLPTVRVPVSSLPFLNITTTGSWRLTTWSKAQDPNNLAQALPTPVWRELFEVQMKIDGPTFSRVFQTPTSGYAEKLKHVFEPIVTFDWKSPINNRNDIIQQDATDYLVGGSTSVTYGFTNHILARRKSKDGSPGQSSEILNVQLSQTYATNPLATAVDSQFTGSSVNPTLATGVSNFTPVALNATATPTDRLNGQFFLNYDTHFHGIASLGASTKLTQGTIQMSAGWSKTNVIDGNPQGFELPVEALNLTTTVKPADKHVGGSYQINWDIVNHTIVQQRVLVYYNSQCCGISFDYQELGSAFGLQANRRFGISITLAGLGSFSNPMGSMGDNSAIR